MKILQIMAPGTARWQEAEVPTPLAGEILIKVLSVTTCPQWDIKIMSGEPMFPGMQLQYPYHPGQPGHETLGEVVGHGNGVTDPPVGSRVAVWRDAGPRRQGCYAQYVCVPSENLISVSESLDYSAITSLELAMCVQVSFDQLIAVKGIEGQRVGIGGLGPAGLIAVQMASAYGAREIVGFDLMPERCKLARTLGAHQATTPDSGSFPDNRQSDTALDTAIDMTGSATSIRYLLKRTKRVLTIFGVLREEIGFGWEHWYGGFMLMGYGEHNRGAAERALDLINSGRLDLSPLVSYKMPMDRYEEGIALLQSKKAIKICFSPWNE